MIIKGTDSENSSSRVADSQWLQSIVEQWEQAEASMDSSHTLNLSTIEFLPLYEWVSTVALIERFLGQPFVRELLIDVRGSNRAPQPGEALPIRARKILNFIESIGTSRALTKEG